MSYFSSKDKKQPSILNLLNSLDVIPYQQLPDNLKKMASDIESREKRVTSVDTEDSNLSAEQLQKMLKANK